MSDINSFTLKLLCFFLWKMQKRSTTSFIDSAEYLTALFCFLSILCFYCICRMEVSECGWPCWWTENQEGTSRSCTRGDEGPDTHAPRSQWGRTELVPCEVLQCYHVTHWTSDSPCWWSWLKIQLVQQPNGLTANKHQLELVLVKCMPIPQHRYQLYMSVYDNFFWLNLCLLPQWNLTGAPCSRTSVSKLWSWGYMGPIKCCNPACQVWRNDINSQ